MVRFPRILFPVAALAASAVAAAPGCRDATQVTIDISLKRAECMEVHGTAITVGVGAEETEQHVRDEYVTASTLSCNAETRQIGTLVVTPTDPNRGSVIVVVAYGNVAAAKCKPPLYVGCIVARRQFTFSKYRNLQLPITIDPICKDVPCDAFSTCRNGQCFSTDVPCDDDSCLEPGDPGDGGTSPDAVTPDVPVLPDGALPDGADPDAATVDAAMDAALDGATDAGADAPTDGAAGDAADGATADSGIPDGVYCDALNNLICPQPTQCNYPGTGSCCEVAGTGFCRLAAASCMPMERQFCCNSCPGAKVCVRGAIVGMDLVPRGPVPQGAPLPGGATPAGTCQ